MDDMLHDLIDCQVQVLSIRGDVEVIDTGALKSYDGNWLCLDRNGGLLYFSIRWIRLIKPL